MLTTGSSFGVNAQMGYPLAPITMCGNRDGTTLIPPIGGHAFHPLRWPITGHTTGAGAGIVESSPQHTGAKAEKLTDTGELRK